MQMYMIQLSPRESPKSWRRLARRYLRKATSIKRSRNVSGHEYGKQAILVWAYLFSRLTDLKALKFLNVHPYTPPGDLDFEAVYVTLRFTILLNSALVALKQNTPKSLRLCIDQATKALDVHSDPVEAGRVEPMTKNLTKEERAKALYRRGSARALLKEYDEASDDLVEAAALVPSDQAIQAELKKVQAKKNELKQKQKKMYAKMFS